MLTKLKNRVKDLQILYKEILFAKGHFNVPFFVKLKMNLQGFTADQYVRYDFKNNDRGDYISEFERWKSRRINGRYNIVMDDKLVFPHVFGNHVDVPKNIAWINGGKIYNLAGGEFSAYRLERLVRKHKQLIAKPVYAQGSGRGVQLIHLSDEELMLDGTRHTPESLMTALAQLSNYVIVEFVRQHNYAANLFAKSTNTIRIISLLDENGQATLTNAVHRIGVEKSAPVDNGTKGALVSEIDMETGMLGPAKTFFQMESFSEHPETGNAIQGVPVPHWQQIKEGILATAEQFPYIPFMAWDIVVTEKGFSVIEVNTSSGVNLFQMWRGERNGPLGQFYRRHGILK